MIQTYIETGNAENLLKEIKELRKENSKLNEINREIFEGFNYAATIQQGLLPQQRHLERLFGEYFVIYEPQTIISGDFYWTAKKNHLTYFAVADCTGHGISGAMLSVLGISYLNYVVLGKEHSLLGDILSEVDRKWIETFNIYGDKSRDNDWMEISICSFNSETRELKFAGANGKTVVANESGSFLLSGDHYPVGGWQIEKDRRYTEHTLLVPENSMVYLSSDGFKDQIGGMNNKTFKQKRMTEFFSDIFYLPAHIQKKFLTVAFHEWKGNNKQTDDVCLLGLRL